MSISTIPSAMAIQTSNFANVGFYTVSLKTTEIYSGLVDIQNFTLSVGCLSSIVPSAPMGSTTYYIGDPTLSTLIPPYSLSPAACSNLLVYNVTMLNGSPLPS